MVSDRVRNKPAKLPTDKFCCWMGFRLVSPQDIKPAPNIHPVYSVQYNIYVVNISLPYGGLKSPELLFTIICIHMHHSSTSNYMPNFIEIEEKFCGRTQSDVRTYVRMHTRMYTRTDGHLRSALLGPLCRRVDLKSGVFG